MSGQYNFCEIKTVEADGTIVYDLTAWLNKPVKKRVGMSIAGKRRKRRNQLELHMDLHNRQAKIRY